MTWNMNEIIIKRS